MKPRLTPTLILFALAGMLLGGAASYHYTSKEKEAKAQKKEASDRSNAAVSRIKNGILTLSLASDESPKSNPILAGLTTKSDQTQKEILARNKMLKADEESSLAPQQLFESAVDDLQKPALPPSADLLRKKFFLLNQNFPDLSTTIAGINQIAAPPSPDLSTLAAQASRLSKVRAMLQKLFATEKQLDPKAMTEEALRTKS